MKQANWTQGRKNWRWGKPGKTLAVREGAKQLSRIGRSGKGKEGSHLAEESNPLLGAHFRKKVNCRNKANLSNSNCCGNYFPGQCRSSCPSNWNASPWERAGSQCSFDSFEGIWGISYFIICISIFHSFRCRVRQANSLGGLRLI